jgi:hypothetical protein
MFAPETFGERQKSSYFKKPRMLCMKFGGAHTTYYLAVPKVQEMDKKLDSHTAKKGRDKISK